MCDIEHFSEFKMAAATILDVWKYPIIFPRDLQGRFIGVFEGGESISGVIFRIRCHVQGQIRGQMSNKETLMYN